MPPRIDPNAVAYWADLARRLGTAPHRERGALVQGAAALKGLSVATVYKRLAEYGGWSSGRKLRADAGRSGLDEETLTTVAAIYREGVRENRKQVMTIDLACSIAEQSGVAVPVSNQQVARLMRQRRMDRASQEQPGAFQQMRSPHPNYLHQVDPSLCLIFYMKGKQYLIRESEYYKNKLEKVAKIKLKVWRYVITDHASSLIWVRYFEAKGESQALLFESLVWAWSVVPGRTGHGAPHYLLMDPGSANTGRGIGGFLDALDVEPIVHLPEQAHVKGQVESSQNIIERHFESRLRFEPVDDIDELNARALEWAEAYNSNSLPRIDSRLRRPGADPQVRTGLWLRIRSEELREIPPRAVCAATLEGRREERKVGARGRISFRHPGAGRSLEYSLEYCDGPHRGDVVEVSPLLVRVDGTQFAARVRWRGLDGAEQVWRLAPIEALDAFGVPLSAPVWATEYKGLHKRDAERSAEAMARVAYPEETAAERDPMEGRRKARRKQVVPFGGNLNAVSHLAEIQTPTYLPRSGTEIGVDIPEERREAVPLVRALVSLSRAWGRPVTDAEHDWISSRFAAGVPAAELDRLLAAGAAGEPAEPQVQEGPRPALSLVR